MRWHTARWHLARWHLAVMLVLTCVGQAWTQTAKSQKGNVPGMSEETLPAGAVMRLGSARYQFQRVQQNRFYKQLVHDKIYATLSPDGTIVAAGASKDGTRISLVDIATGKALSDFRTEDPVTELQFARGSDLLVTNVLLLGHLDLFERSTGNKLGSFAGTDNTRDRKTFALSADSQWLATQPGDDVVIWDIGSGKLVAAISVPGREPHAMTFGPGRKRFLLQSSLPAPKSKGDFSFVVSCIDIGARKVIAQTTLSKEYRIALCPDGETIAFARLQDDKLHVKHMPSGAERCVLPIKAVGFAFLPDGESILVIDGKRRAALWSTANTATEMTGVAKKVRDLEGRLNDAEPHMIGISQDGKTIAVLDNYLSARPTVVAWNSQTGKRRLRPPGHRGTVTCLAYGPHGKVLASASADGTVQLWDAASGAHLRVQSEHDDAVIALVFSRDGKRLASSSKDGVICVSRVRDGQEICRLAGPEGGATALAFSPRADVLFAGGPRAEIHSWKIDDVQLGSERELLKVGGSSKILALADGGELALAVASPGGPGMLKEKQRDEALIVWDIAAKQAVTSMPLRLGIRLPEQGNGMEGAIDCKAGVFSADGRMIAASQMSRFPAAMQASLPNQALRIWERKSGQPIAMLAETTTDVLGFSSEGRLLASGRLDQGNHATLKYAPFIDVWDVCRGEKIGTLPTLAECVAFSPDGKFLATTGSDHTILIWNVPQSAVRRQVSPLTEARKEAWWAALGGNAKEAYLMMGEMADAAESAIELLKLRVQPARTLKPATMVQLVAELGSRKYLERVQAQAELEKVGEGALPYIKKALAGGVDLEMRLRLEKLLEKCDHSRNVHGLRMHRAVAVLEWIGTPEARAVLQAWTNGAPESQLVIEARDALSRLAERNR